MFAFMIQLRAFPAFEHLNRPSVAVTVPRYSTVRTVLVPGGMYSCVFRCTEVPAEEVPVPPATVPSTGKIVVQCKKTRKLKTSLLYKSAVLYCTVVVGSNGAS